MIECGALFSLTLLRDLWRDVCVRLAWTMVLVCLSALAMYRREMSCNRGFHDEDSEAEDASADDDDDDTVVVSPRQNQEEMEFETDLLLEGAGLYCSGAPLRNIAATIVGAYYDNDGDVRPNGSADAVTKCQLAPPGLDPFVHSFPTDVHAHISSFLTAKDVVSLIGVSKAYWDLVENGESSRRIWKQLWDRDYAWVMYEWDVGRQAFERSRSQAGLAPQQELEPDHSKDFYFMFRQTYLNYVIAGQTTVDRCLVGLHRDVYDITPFLERHPGSPETILVHAGRDATAFFEDMRHSTSARRIAASLCVLIDHSDDGCCGLVATPHTKLVGEGSPSLSIPTETRLSRRQLRHRKFSTLNWTRSKYERELASFRRKMERRFAGDEGVIGSVNCYFDPICGAWRVWYMNELFQPVFVVHEG